MNNRSRHATPTVSDSIADDLAAMLERRRLALTVGAGGVGKTTVSAAIATAAAAKLDARVLVLTIDPARRLADAFGIEVGDEARRVPERVFAEAGVDPKGQLWVGMLDTEAGWADLIARHAPKPSVRDAILENQLFRNLTSRFVQSHGYLAMERMWEVADDYDLVVVDTPPSRNTLDILDAPARMVDFFGSGLLRWLIAPYRSRLFSAASRPFYLIADRILGRGFLADITEFFVLFQQLAPTFKAHAAEVEALLRDAAEFAVVTTLEDSPAREAAYLISELTGRGYTLGGVIANRVLPEALRTGAVAESGDRLAVVANEPSRLSEVLSDVSSLGGEVGSAGVNGSGGVRDEADQLDGALSALAAAAPLLIRLADREAAVREMLAAHNGAPMTELALRGRGVDNMSDLAAMIGLA